MSLLKFAKFRTSASLDDTGDIVHNLFFQNFKGKIEHEIVGVVMFRFETKQIGKFAVLFDVFQKNPYESKTSGVYPVQEKYLEYVEGQPKFVVERLLVALTLLVTVRDNLATAGAIFESEQDALSFMDASLDAYRKSIRTSCLQLRTVTERRRYMAKTKKLVGLFEQTVLKGMSMLKGGADKAKAYEIKVDNHRESLLKLRSSMYELRNTRRCLMHWQFVVDKRCISEHIDKELLFLYGDYDVTKVFSSTEELFFFSKSINTRKLIDIAIDIFYTEEINCSVADVVKIVPFYVEMRCFKLLTKCFAYIERMMDERDLVAMIECTNQLNGFHKSTMEILVQMLSHRMLRDRQDVMENLLSICRNENAPPILRLKTKNKDE